MTQGAVLGVRIMTMICPFCKKEEETARFRWFALPPEPGYVPIYQCKDCGKSFAPLPGAEPLTASLGSSKI